MIKIKIIDCHCHVYPEAISEKAVVNIGKFYEIEMSGGGTIEDLLTSGKEAGISQFLIFSVATAPRQTTSINEFIARTVSAHADCLSGLGTLHPDSADPYGDIKHLQELGLKGVKLHHDFQAIAADDPRSMKIYEICEELNLPVLLHTGDYRYDYSNPNRVKNILKAFPKLTVVGAHLGGWSIWTEAAKELADYPNFCVDSSSSFYALKSPEVEKIIRTYGCKRVLFGSDYPMWSPARDLNELLNLNFSQEELEDILYKNTERVFQI